MSEEIQSNIPIPEGFEEAYKERKDYPQIEKIIEKIKEKENERRI